MAVAEAGGLYPVVHPGEIMSKSKKNTQQKQFGCPHCGSTEGFTSNEIVEATAGIQSFDADGDPVYEGESDADWNSQKLDPQYNNPITCDGCGKRFAKPVPVGLPLEAPIA